MAFVTTREKGLAAIEELPLAEVRALRCIQTVAPQMRQRSSVDASST